mmetsp:Transcript_68619/g.146912  ORF Transcript_68619/g.146912 Transcript_68619/m.146912 type:complete len:514 (-) Transcript_68619:31-1572(-)
MAPPSAIRVRVQKSTDDEFEIELKPNQSIKDLKAAVEDHWNTPPECQKLVSGSTTLEDSTKIADVGSDEPVPIMMELTFDAVRKCLEGSGSQEKIDQLENLRQMGPGAGEEVVAMVFARLDDARADVRLAALRAIGDVSAQDNKKILQCLTSRVTNTDPKIRCAALESLGKVAAKGDERVIGLAISHSTDNAWDVRRAAMETLGKVAERGVDRAVVAAMPRLQDIDVCVKRAAVESLGKLARKGDKEAIGSTAFLVQDPDEDVRAAAVYCLADLAIADSLCDYEAVNSGLQEMQGWMGIGEGPDPEAGVGMDAPSGNIPIVDVILERCDDHGKDVRVAAVACLGRVAEKGNVRAIWVLSEILEPATLQRRLRNPAMRCAALRSLAMVSFPDGQGASDKNAKESKKKGQKQSLESRSVELITRCMKDLDSAVRRTAVEVIAQVAKRGDQAVVEAAMTCLKDSKKGVRQAAVEALPLLVLKQDNNKDVISEITACLEDTDVNVRRVAKEVLAQMT